MYSVVIVALVLVGAEVPVDMDFGGVKLSAEQYRQAESHAEAWMGHEATSKFASQVVAGLQVADGMFPFAALIMNGNQPHCGAAILNEMWVLTSAFCTMTESSDQLRLLAGSADYATPSASAQWRVVDWATTNPHWRSSTTVGGLALMHLTEPLEWTTYVQPIQVRSKPFRFPATVTSMGWGSTTPGKPFVNFTLSGVEGRVRNPDYTAKIPTNMLWQNFYLLDDFTANKRFARFFGLNHFVHTLTGRAQLFTGSDFRGTCSNGDDGSPLVVPIPSDNIKERKYELVGINVWRLSCSGSVDIWADVHAFRRWIDGAMYQMPEVNSPRLRVTLFPVQSSVPAWAQFRVLFPQDDIGNELWITKPPGFLVDYTNDTKALAVSGLPHPTWVTTLGTDIVQLRWDNPVQTDNMTAAWFVLNNIRADGTCYPQAWTVRSYLCLEQTPTPTLLPTHTHTPENTRTYTNIPTGTPIPTSTPVNTKTPIPTATDTATYTATRTGSDSGTLTGSDSTTNTPTVVMPQNTATPLPTMTPNGQRRGCVQTQLGYPFTVVMKPVDDCVPSESRHLFTTLTLRVPWAAEEDTKRFRKAMAYAANNHTMADDIEDDNVVVLSAVAPGLQAVVEWKFTNIRKMKNGVDAMDLQDHITEAEMYMLNHWLFTQRVGSGQAEVANKVTIQNMPPALAWGSVAEVTLEDVALEFERPLEIVDDSEKGENMTLRIDVPGPGGVVKLETYEGLHVIAGDTDTSHYTVRGTKAALNEALEEIKFAPAENWHGRIVFQITVDDEGNPAGSVGGAMEAVLYVAVRVAPVNDVPTIMGGSYWMLEDTVQAFMFVIDDVDAGPSAPLAVVIRSHHGTFELNETSTIAVDGNGTWKSFMGNLSSVNAAVQWITFTPDANFFGDARLEFEVDDMGAWPPPARVGQLQQIINVRPLNDAPILAATTTVSGREDEAINIPVVKLGDVDLLDGSASVNISVSNGTITFPMGIVAHKHEERLWRFTGTSDVVNTALAGLVYVGDENWWGVDVVHITVEDNHYTGPGSELLASLDIVVQVRAVNDAPTVQAPSAVTFDRDSQVTIAVVVDDVDADAMDLEVNISVTSGLLSVRQPADVSMPGQADPRLKVVIPAGATPTRVENFLSIRGPLHLLNYALAQLVYVDNKPPGPPITHIEFDFHNLDFLHVSVSDLGNSGEDGPLMATTAVNVTVTAELFPTCKSFVNTHSSFCGCYYQVGSSTTSALPWVTLPIDFPSGQFRLMTTPARFMQGCCAKQPSAVRQVSMTTVGHLDVCQVP